MGKAAQMPENYRVKGALSQDLRFAAVAKCVRIRFTWGRLSPGSSHAFEELAPKYAGRIVCSWILDIVVVLPLLRPPRS